MLPGDIYERVGAFNLVLRRALRGILPDRKRRTTARHSGQTGGSTSDGLIDLKYTFYHCNDRILYCRYNAGLFSNFTVTLWGIIDLYDRGLFPDQISFQPGLKPFKADPEADITDELLAPHRGRPPARAMPGRLARHDHHGRYREYDFTGYAPLLARYFEPAAEVRRRAHALQRQAGVDPATTLAVCYRGTDKAKEVPRVDPARYLDTTRTILTERPHLDTVLIQTDEAHVRHLFQQNFAERCVFFPALPVTEGRSVIHSQLAPDERTAFAQNMLAAVLAMAACDIVLTHTGNVGAWTALYRGSAYNLYQFDAAGALLAPPANS